MKKSSELAVGYWLKDRKTNEVIWDFPFETKREAEEARIARGRKGLVIVRVGTKEKLIKK